MSKATEGPVCVPTGELDLLTVANAVVQVTPEQVEQLKAEVTEQERKLAALRELLRIVQLRLGQVEEKRQRRSRTPREGGEEMRSLKELIFDVISQHGPGTPADIARKLTAGGHPCSAKGVRISAARSEWFTYDDAEDRILIAHTTGRD